jgi:hypothetical protein
MLVDRTDQVMDPDTDSVAYVELAHGLRKGCGFARLSNGTCFSPEINRTPGYPVFLSLLSNLWVALIVQTLLSGLMIFALGNFASARWGLSAGIVASRLVALDVPSIVYSDEIMTETLFTVFLSLAFWPCFARRIDDVVKRKGLLS